MCGSPPQTLLESTQLLTITFRVRPPHATLLVSPLNAPSVLTLSQSIGGGSHLTRTVSVSLLHHTKPTSLACLNHSKCCMTTCTGLEGRTKSSPNVFRLRHCHKTSIGQNRMPSILRILPKVLVKIHYDPLLKVPAK